MILTIDIGNTNIVLGCIDGDKTLFVERLSTVRTKTGVATIMRMRSPAGQPRLSYQPVSR